jgi:hypothetical protein
VPDDANARCAAQRDGRSNGRSIDETNTAGQAWQHVREVLKPSRSTGFFITLT